MRKEHIEKRQQADCMCVYTQIQTTKVQMYKHTISFQYTFNDQTMKNSRENKYPVEYLSFSSNFFFAMFQIELIYE